LVITLALGCTDADTETPADASGEDPTEGDEVTGGTDGDDDDDDDDPIVPFVIPIHTTDCTMDADGCLGNTDTHCAIELDEPIAGHAVDIRVDGALLGGGYIEVSAFAVTNGYFWSGYSAMVQRFGNDEALRALLDDTRTTLTSDSWPVPESTTDYPVTLFGSFDVDAQYGEVTIDADDAPTDTLSTPDMLPTTQSTRTTILVSRATVCNIVSTEP